jgi:hypothetical protein
VRITLNSTEEALGASPQAKPRQAPKPGLQASGSFCVFLSP